MNEKIPQCVLSAIKAIQDAERQTAHAGDCTIYAAYDPDDPLSGICTCGYGWRQVRVGNHKEMFSPEREAAEQAKEPHLD